MPFTEVNGRTYYVQENAKIRYRNFAGKVSDKNPAGERNFCLEIPDKEEAEAMKEQGWNIKYREIDDLYYVPVAVEFNKGRPPQILIKTANNEMFYDQESVKNLDGGDLMGINIVVNPSYWKGGIKAYLKYMEATLIDGGFYFGRAHPLNTSTPPSQDDDVPFDI